MLAHLSFSLLVGMFIFASVIVWFACIQLSRTTDIIDLRFHFGEAFGGLIFLALVTNLPEIAIMISAALRHNMGIAVGNILGGIALQTVVLVILDGVGLGNHDSLTYRAASLQLVLEGVLVISVLVIAIMGTQLPQSVIYASIAPVDLLIAITWLVGIGLVIKSRSGLPWHEKGRAPDTMNHVERQSLRLHAKKQPTRKVLFVFIVAAIVTFAAGYLLELTSSEIVTRIGWSGVLFGSTILAFVTALPEISTGLAAVRIGDYTMAVSDIFGGNAFLPVLFLPATLLTGKPVLPLADHTDIYLASLGALLTAVYIFGLIFRPRRQFFCLGIDSVVVLIIYSIGIAGLFTI